MLHLMQIEYSKNLISNWAQHNICSIVYFPTKLGFKKRHFSVVDADKLDTRFLLFSNGLLFCTLLTCVNFFSLVGALFKKRSPIG